MWPEHGTRYIGKVKTDKDIAIEIAESEIKALENLLENAKNRLESLKKQ